MESASLLPLAIRVEVLLYAFTALEAIQRDIQEAGRDSAPREPPATQEPPSKVAPTSTEKLLKLSEAAAFLGVSNSWLHRKTMISAQHSQGL